MATNLEGGGVKALVAGPLKKDRYFFAASLTMARVADPGSDWPALATGAKLKLSQNIYIVNIERNI